MKIKESNNLKYDKFAKALSSPEDYDQQNLHPRVCTLDRIERTNGTITLYFKNKTRAVIKGKDPGGNAEIDLIESKLRTLIGSSYEEILDTEI